MPYQTPLKEIKVLSEIMHGTKCLSRSALYIYNIPYHSKCYAGYAYINLKKKKTKKNLVNSYVQDN